MTDPSRTARRSSPRMAPPGQQLPVHAPPLPSQASSQPLVAPPPVLSASPRALGRLLADMRAALQKHPSRLAKSRQTASASLHLLTGPCMGHCILIARVTQSCCLCLGFFPPLQTVASSVSVARNCHRAPAIEPIWLDHADANVTFKMFVGLYVQSKPGASLSPCRQTTTSGVRGEVPPCCPSALPQRLPVPRSVTAPRPDTVSAGGACSPHAGRARLAGSMVMSASQVQHVQ